MTIETWTECGSDTVVVRVKLGSDVYERRLNYLKDDDYRDLRIAGQQMRYAELVDSHLEIPEADRAASRCVQHALAVETIFPELYHDPRLPA